MSLEELARSLAREPGLLVAINVGSPGANRELAQRRADAIAAFLHKNGIDIDNVSIVGFGSPASTAADDPASYPVSFERRCPSNLPSTTLCENIEISGDYKIEYEVDSAVIRPASKEMLERDVLWILQAHPKVRVQVQGHTSSEGKLEHNMDLSRRRAQSVVDYLVSRESLPIASRPWGMAASSSAFGRVRSATRARDSKWVRSSSPALTRKQMSERERHSCTVRQHPLGRLVCHGAGNASGGAASAKRSPGQRSVNSIQSR